ncbi:carboxymuconolactone decarboxylase family protein [Streptacidiphilus cavernicola]|uniref:Carboxymuconolactone decarboxylase family protein n=1 Tax=Streptacidiphilus cavernicola TaxID=3342716 RepID=A0ABV6W541_9ACTN
MPANAVDPNETTAARRLRGEKIAAELSGDPSPALLEVLDRDFPFLANALTSYAVGEVLARTVLDVRTRQLALVAAFAALGLGDFVKIHGGYALNAGVTEDELKEIVYLTTIPAGFARAVQASQAVAELLASRRQA